MLTRRWTAKGLEYDAAVVRGPGARCIGESPAGTTAPRYYVALTRATQRLYVVTPD